MSVSLHQQRHRDAALRTDTRCTENAVSYTHLLDRKYIQLVKPLTDHVLQVDFISGSRLLLDMKPYLDKLRFRSLSDPQVWNSAVTNGIFVRFGDVEMSHNELFSMAEQEH